MFLQSTGITLNLTGLNIVIEKMGDGSIAEWEKRMEKHRARLRAEKQQARLRAEKQQKSYRRPFEQNPDQLHYSRAGQQKKKEIREEWNNQKLEKWI